MARRANRPLKRNTHPKGIVLDLGLAVSGALLPAGQFRSLPEIAAYAGCSKQCISLIEQTALKKIRTALHKRGVRSLATH